MTPTRALRIAFYAWNAAIRNAHAEYEAHPTAACRGTDNGPGGTGPVRVPCDELAQTGDIYCPRHRVRADKRNAAHRKGARK